MSFKPITKSKNGKWKGSGSGSKYAKLNDKGGWGSRKKVSFRKAIPAVVMLFLFLILSIGNYGGPIPFVFGDYNTSFSHTRTNIFTDAQMLGPTSTSGPIAFKSKVNATTNANPATTLALPALSVAVSDTVLIDIFDGGNCAGCFSATDTAGNTYAFKVGTSAAASNSYVLASTVTIASGSDVVTVSTSPNPARIFDAVGIVYSGVTGFGNTATEQTNFASSGQASTVTITTSANSVVHEAFFFSGDAATVTISMTSAQTLRNSDGSGVAAGSHEGLAGSAAVSTEKGGLSPGSNSLSLTETSTSPSCGTSCHRGHSALELKGSGSPAITDFSKVRWNFNSTCVTMSGPNSPEMIFDYALGTTGSGGKNCNSADIAITKSSFNIQAASGRQMEMVMAWNHIINSPIKNVTVVLRTNGTLPSFTTNYNPFNDINARMIWQACPAPICAGGLQSLWILHDNTKTLNQETQGNDLIIKGPDANFNNANAFQNAFQVVLNFTGPINYLQSNSVTNSTNSASSLQFGEDYFLLVQSQFDTTVVPSGFGDSFVGGQNPPNGVGDPSFGIWSVPSACTDPINKVACSLPAAQPVFQFNVLDPSTWGNAIIKGLVWVFLTAIPGGLVIMISGFFSVLQSGLNFIGNQVGWGNVGDSTFAFFNNVGSFLLTSTPLGWVVTLVKESIDEITAFGSWFGTWTGGLAVAVKDLIFAVPLIGNIVVKIFVFLPTSYILMDLLFWFYYCAEGGLSGMAHWFEWNKWMAFATYGILEKFVNAFLSLISWLVGKIPTLDGTNLPRLPSIEGGSVPSVRIDLGIPAIRKGDPFSILGFILGSVFSWLWITSASGPAGNALYLGSVTKFSALNPLLFIFVSFAGLMMIPLLPAYLVKITTGALETEKGAIF
jgi:hypothetical protein